MRPSKTISPPRNPASARDDGLRTTKAPRNPATAWDDELRTTKAPRNPATAWDDELRITNAEFIKGAVRWDDLPDDGRPEVAFIGRSNVGKSSLLNKVVGRRALARTSGTPGKTQQFNFYLVTGRMYLVDLPGYGYAKISRKERERWGRFIGKYLTERQPLRLVYHLVDSRHAPTDLDCDIMQLMRGSDVPYIITLTKSDKLSGNERTKSVRRVTDVLAGYGMEVPVILTSSKTGRGLDEMMDWISAVVTENG